MPIKPLSHLRLLNTTPTAHTLYLTKTSLSLMKPHNITTTTTAASYYRTPHVLSRIFPFKLKYLALSQHQHHQFSTRSRHAGPGRARAEFKGPGPKSLIDDEAELSDWVSELRTSSNLRGRATSDEEESESYGVRRKGRTMAGGSERGRDGFSVKRRRGEERGSLSRSDFKGKRWVGHELDSDNERDRFRSERHGGVGVRAEKRRGSFSRRENRFGGDLDDDDDDDNEEEKGYGLRRERRESWGNVGRRDGVRGGREQGFGFKKDGRDGVRGGRERGFGFKKDGRDGVRGGRERGSGFKKDLRGAVRGRRGFSDDDGSGGFDGGDERELLMKGIGDLLGEEESDDVGEIEDGDADVDNNVRSSFGFKEEIRSNVTTISPGKSGSYLSETR